VAVEAAMEAKEVPVEEVDTKLLNSMMIEFNVLTAAVNSLSLPVKDTCLTASNL
jgi:hypothetical protein